MRRKRQNQWHKLLPIAVYIVWACLLIDLLHTGEITRYIRPTFIWHSALTAVLYIIFALVALVSACRRGHDEGPRSGIAGYVLLIAPAIVGLVMPPDILGADVATKRGFNLNHRAQVEHQITQEESIVINNSTFVDVLDALYDDPEHYAGRQVSYTGFVAYADDLAANQFWLARLVVTCHVAHAMPGGVIVETSESFPPDTWLEVTGILDTGTYYDETVPVIHPEIMRVTVPLNDPYVFAGL